MKATFISFGLIASVSANIVFNHVPLSCDIRSSNLYYGCLEGQNCTDDGTNECYVPSTPMPSRYYPVPVKDRTIEPRQAVYSTDGTCGPANGNTLCDPNSTVYKGSCCSSYGWCGNDEAHCGTGCLSGCTGGTTTPSGTSPRSDGRCGSAFGGATCDANGEYGGCCSSYGYCGSTTDHCLASNGCQNGCTGSQSSSAAKTTTTAAAGSAPSSSTTQEPVIAPVTSTLTPAAASSAPVTTDGSCGTANGGTVCGNWVNGNCCSMYGFCGSTNAHCGAGCQSGDCLNAPAVAAPGASPAPAAPVGGAFNIVGSSGVPAMHAALMPNGRVMFLDKLENYTQLKLPNGYYAMSSEYDPATNAVATPLAYKTNAFCSGGTFLADGRVVSLGGNAPLDWLDPNIGDGFDAIRYLERSSTDASLNGKDWSEPGNKLASARWYATAQTMGDGTIFVASGSLNGLDPTVKTNNNPTYEILSATAVSQGKNIDMEILEKNQPYYMYPFVHLLNDGNLFVFVSKSSQVLNVGTNTIVKELPELAGDYRTYPNTGGSVLLPLSSANKWNPDIIICGGGAYQDITSPTEPSCGRIQPLSANPTWELDAMPEGRGMVEGTLLPDGTVVWLNGGNLGAQGFGLAKDPTLEALLYDPTKAKGQRFSTLATSTIPRLYHSVSLLLLDGTLMVAGSNPVEMPKLQPDAADPYVTEFRVENYVPPYLSGDNAKKRPTNVKLSSGSFKADGSTLDVTFDCPAGAKAVTVTLYHGGFVTHSVHMGHRMLHLDNTGFVAGATQQKLTVTRPPNNNVAPPGPYVVYILVDGIPAMGQFVTV
ncbi:Bcgo1 [Botrytis cinerea B05.10]|uniref:Bcgo1 n=3 Tax=Botryotinia fuckeliana TaxID=40559 RepID=A0A384JJI6_BOTFB|nr:Bcgo1 [Botrytis cinerea B05.10]ATZ50700.1 Bcgo1 [Botrytis cinerea B05.10]EMR88454.1 putative glyoxal oxidase protein [Botrytis cinerea BcDW1]CCD49084.1 carbohydrate-Binding Module family 18 protein [Botrytis cinerea T4]